MLGRAIAVTAIVLAANIFGPLASADDGAWHGTIATESEASCDFSELPVEATISGGNVVIRLTFKGQKRTFKAPIGGNSVFQAYTHWHTWPGYGDGGPQQASIKGTVAGGVLKANFWTIGVPRRFCTAKLQLARAAPDPPPPAAGPPPPQIVAVPPTAPAPIPTRPAPIPTPPAPAPAIANAPAAEPQDPLVGQLDTLRDLREKGLIDDEYESRRASLLDRFVGSAPAPRERPAAPSALPAEEPRIALIIGNSTYANMPLANPENDARLMAATLRSVGFEVTELINADQKQMKRAVRDFGERLERTAGRAIALFYYAGHGVQVGGRNYLIPVGARISRESDVDIESVAADSVLGTLSFARTRTNLVILDACRNNPYARGFRSLSTGLARMDAPQGTLIAYVTAPGQVAADGTGANSPYTAALAQAIVQHPEPVEQVLKRVRLSVMAATSETQVPWEASSLTTDFYFRR